MTTITATTMTSGTTRHHATYRPEMGTWRVTWLPDRDLTRNQAITAMTLAETVSQGLSGHDDPMWSHVDSWADELNLTGPDVVGRIADTAVYLGLQDNAR